MNKVIESTYEQFIEISYRDYLKKIKCYESNLLLLDNITSFNDSHEFQDYMLVLAEYARSLEQIGRYSTAIRYADRFLDLLQEFQIDYNIKLDEYTFYRSILSLKARSYYELEKYKLAQRIFERLRELDPDNDNYKLWIEEIKDINRTKISELIVIIAVVLIILSFIPSLDSYLLFPFGMVLYLIASIELYYGGKIFKFFKSK